MVNAKLAGLSGLIWGVLALLAYLGIFIFIGRAASGGGTGGAMIISIIGLAAAIFLAIMLVGLAGMLGGIGAIACFVGAVLSILLTLLPLLKIQGGFLLIVSIVLGVCLILAGVFALMDKKTQTGVWKAFAILLIVAGALKAIVVGELIYPFVACAAGICAFLALPKRA